MSRSISAKSSKAVTDDADADEDLLATAPPNDAAAFVADACLSRMVEFKSDTMRSIRALRSAAGGGEEGASDASLPSPPAPTESDGRPSVASSVARRSSMLDGAVLGVVIVVILPLWRLWSLHV